jgi:DNA-binding transcriptional LysR family regulator
LPVRREQQLSRQLKLRHLEVLLAVVQWGSMARAAQHLAITQPVISKSIADLELIVGVRLLDRTSHGVEPTLYGRALLKRSAALFNDVRASISELECLADPAGGELRIGTTEPMTAGLLCTIVDRLSRLHPRVAFQVKLGDPPQLQDRELRERDIDLMIGRLPKRTAAADDMDVEILLEEQAFAVAGFQNPLTRRRKLTLAELINECWTLPPPESYPGSLIADVFRACNLSYPRNGVTVHSNQMQTALLATGRFLTILPGTMLHFSAERLQLKILPVNLGLQPWQVGIVTLKNRMLSPIAQRFIDCARVVAKEYLKSNKLV